MSQSNETIVNIANEIIGNVSYEEAVSLHEYYQSDNNTNICPLCEHPVNESELLYIVSEAQTWDDPEEGYNACPCCREEISSSSLEKPSFSVWLKLTA